MRYDDDFSRKVKAAMQRAKEKGKRLGRHPEDDQSFLRKEASRRIAELLKAGQGIRETARQAGCSTNTVIKTRAILQRQPQIAHLRLWLDVERNNKFVRGRKRAIEDIECFVLRPLRNYRKKGECEYVFDLEYASEEALEREVYHLWAEMERYADWRNCFVEGSIYEPATERSW